MLVALINSFNRVDLLKTALPCLAETLPASPRPTAVVVFDAGSSDGSREYVAEFFRTHPAVSGFQVLSEPGEPNTFSDGINRGCAAAIAAYPDLKWLLLFETDNWTADAGPFDQAITLMESHPELGAVGFTVRKYDGGGQGYGCRFPTATSFVLGPYLAAALGLEHAEGAPVTEPAGIDAFQCDAVYTSPIVIRREAWEKSGGLDPIGFPFSDCDIDWAWRLKKLGWQQAVIRTDKVVHDNRENLSNWSQTRVFHLHRARFKFLRRHRATPGWLVKAGLMIRHAMELVALALLFHRPKHYFPRLKKRAALLAAAPRGYES